jgi:hypothetical protein
MRVGAPQEGDLHRARQFDVGDELAAAVQVALVLSARQGGADSPSLIRHRTASPATTASTPVIVAARFAQAPRHELLPATPWRISNSDPAQ